MQEGGKHYLSIFQERQRRWGKYGKGDLSFSLLYLASMSPRGEGGMIWEAYRGYG